MACAYTATGNLPLQFEPAGSTWDTVVADAAAQSTPATPPGSSNPSPGGTPVYHSTKLEETTLEGDFTADANTTSLAIFSDDGCDVSIGPDVDHLTNIWNRRDQAQALPDLLNSLHVLPITLVAGSTYHIRVGYSNVIYTGDGDIDGVTLFTWANPPAAVVPFSLSVSPTTVTLPVGGSGSTTVTVTGISGFADTVSLGAYDLPPGVTASFAPASVQATGTSTLAFTVSQSTTPGSYSVTISGTYKGVHLTIPLTLNVTDFTLSANPSTLAIPPGGSRATTISMTPLYGFSGSVPLTVSGAPTGMITGLSPTSVSVGNGSVLTISTAPSVVRDTYTLTVSGVANGLTRIATVTVKISDPQVTVTISNLQDVYVGSPVTATATASVDPLPGGYSASDLVATWSPYTTAYIEYSLTGTDDLWNDPGDGSTAGVTLNGAATDPAGTFTGTFNTEGSYEACIGATVSFHNPTTGENFGPYTGYGFATNDGYTGSAAAPAPSIRSAAAMPVRPRQLSAGTPPAGGINGKITVRSASATINIPYLDAFSKVNPGGLVVLNVASEGNSAPAQEIRLGTSHGKVGQTLTVTFSVIQTGTGVIRVYDADAKRYVTNTTNNVFSINVGSYKSLYVEGFGSGSVGTGITGFSKTMGDVTLRATANRHIDSAVMTVLWVDTPNFAERNSLPAHIPDPYPSTLARMGWGEVIAAVVHPSTFAYPNEPGYYSQNTDARHPNNDTLVHLTRDVYYTDWEKQGRTISKVNSGSWSPTFYGPGNDTSPSVYRHDQPELNGGKIDDKDGAGLSWDIVAPMTVFRTRNNFRAWAVVTLPSQQAAAIRCSPIMGYINVFSMQNASSGYNDSWTVIIPPDINGDLNLVPGITPVSYDLK